MIFIFAKKIGKSANKLKTMAFLVRSVERHLETATDDAEETCGTEWSGTEGLVVIVVALVAGVIAKVLLSGTRMP